MAQSSLSFEHVRHLLAHTGFGGTQPELADLRGASRQTVVRRLLGAAPSSLPAMAWAEENDTPMKRPSQLSEAEKRNFLKENRQHLEELSAAWLRAMMSSRTPAEMLQQRLILFWHGHFATQVRKVKRGAFIYGQLKLFHDHALGNYGELLHAIVRDPAMILFLDNNANRAGKPNENLARELMELFSLGTGNYTEDDVHEGARALTGYSLGRQGFQLRRFAHDSGQKTILGKTGRFNGDEFVDIILEQPACARFMVEKLWRHFASDHAPPDLMAELATLFRANNYELKPLLQAMFTHDAFYGEQVVGQQIRSPLHLLIGTCRQLGLAPEHRTAMAFLRHTGQVPYAPPNVKGWPGGRAWIDTSRLLMRYGFAELIAEGGKAPAMRGMMQGKGMAFDPEPLFYAEQSPAEQVESLCQWLLPSPPPSAQRDSLVLAYKQDLSGDRIAAQRRLVGNIMLLPQFQLI